MRTLLSAFVVVLTLACGQPQQMQPMPTQEELNKELLHSYHVTVWEQHRLDLAGGFLAPDFAVRSYPSSMPLGQQAGADYFYKFVSAFPDLTSREEAIFASGDRVSIQWTMHATHSADFFGVAPTGKQFTVSGMDVLRVENGKFVEQWGGIADQMDEILFQLGIPSASDLNGVWETACYQRTKTRLSYSDLKLTGTYTEYADDNCASAIHVSTWKGNATVGASINGGARKLDLEFTSFKSTPLTADNAAFNNQNAYCGFSDWAPNVEKDVLGQPCIYFSIPTGGKSLDLYVREANSLKFGQGAKIGANLSETDRPSAIDDTRVFTRL